MDSQIWVYLEQNEGRLENVSLELTAKAQELAASSNQKVCGLLLGSQVARLAEEALSYGFDEVYVVDNLLLETYRTDSYAEAASAVIQERQPNIFLLGATANGRDLAGRLAVRFKTGLTADCTSLEIKTQDGQALLVGEVTGFGGGIAALIVCPKKRPQMATVRPGIFRPAAAQNSKGQVILREAKIDASKIRTEILETHKEGVSTDITKAKHLVVGGRGTKGDFSLLYDLAKLLGADVGATRVAVDEGWVSRELQIGQTGYACRPQAALVCGVSGALQFTVGLNDAGKIAAINSDSEAPIFESADYCVVGDMFQILPALIEEIKKKADKACKA